MTTPQNDSGGAPSFVTTRWTQVLSARGASPEAHAALGELCEAYWMPVFRFVRRSGPDEETARDLTQAFFARLLAGPGLDSVEPRKGRFRSYLLGAVKHFLADQRDRAAAAKRGAGQLPLVLEAQFENHTTAELQIPDPSAFIPDTFFDRHWAFNLLDRALGTLSAELAAAQKQKYFDLLKPWLVGDVSSISPDEVGRELDLTKGALKVAIYRLRKRFREVLKAEIAHTVSAPEQVQEELKYLVQVLAEN